MMVRMKILGESFDELRATRTSMKWRAYPPDVLPVWVAEMDAAPCGPVVDAVTAALRRGDTGYRWAPPYAEAFAAFAHRRWDWQVDPARMFIVPDVMIGIAELLHANTPPHAAVVVSPPCYDSFYGFVESVGRRLIEARLGPDQRLDAAALEAAFSAAGPDAAYVLCNPQNPTGTVHTAAELAEVARLADQHGVLVISDEIHAPLMFPGVAFTPYLSVPGAARGVALVSASKAWNLAGLKAALAVPGPSADGVVHRLHEVVTHGANHLGVIAQTAAYGPGVEWLDQVCAELVQRRQLLRDLLADRLPEIVLTPAQATYLAWLDCTGLGLADPTATFLDRGRVALAAGTNYDRTAKQWARFNLATSPDVIDEAVRRMAGAVR
jgi:cystathionine beta-lyase